MARNIKNIEIMKNTGIEGQIVSFHGEKLNPTCDIDRHTLMEMGLEMMNKIVAQGGFINDHNGNLCEAKAVVVLASGNICPVVSGHACFNYLYEAEEDGKIRMSTCSVGGNYFWSCQNLYDLYTFGEKYNAQMWFPEDRALFVITPGKAKEEEVA